MIDRFLNQLHERVGAQIRETVSPARYGIVHSYDGERHAVKVAIQPVKGSIEDNLTGWIPIHTAQAGPNGTGIWSAPTPGDLARLEAIDGNTDFYKVTGFEFHGRNVPSPTPAAFDGSPVKLSPGETVIRGPNGLIFRICADGTFYLDGDFNLLGNLKVRGNVDVTGYVKATENVESAKEVKDKHDTLDHLRANYNTHGHTGVQTGAGVTGTTNKTD